MLVKYIKQHSGGELQQLDFKYQCRIWRNDATGTLGAVSQFGRNHQPAFTADLHTLDAFIPAADHIAAVNREAEGFVAVEAGIKLGVVFQPASVVDNGGLAFARGSFAIADGYVRVVVSVMVGTC